MFSQVEEMQRQHSRTTSRKPSAGILMLPCELQPFSCISLKRMKQNTLWKKKRDFEGGWMHLYWAMPVAPVDCLVGHCSAQPRAHSHDWESGISVPSQGIAWSRGIAMLQCKSPPQRGHMQQVLQHTPGSSGT